MSLKKLVFAIILSTLSVANLAAQTNAADPSSAIRRGNERFAKAQYDEAVREYRRVPEDAGEAHAQALYNIGVCYYELWRTEEAIAFYRRAVDARGGRYPKASYALGVALENLGSVQAAKAAYQQVITTAGGENAEASFRLGLLLGSEGDYSAAAGLFRKVCARSSDFTASSHNNLGVMLAFMGRLVEAGREFELALRQAGGKYDDAANNLKLCRTLLAGQAKTAIADLRVSYRTDRPIKKL